MAHPIVDKLQDFGIRHGEKIGVALVSAACLFMLWTAMSQPSIELTVDEINSAASRARQNLQNPQKEEDIIAKIRADGVAQPKFEQIVDNRKPGSADASKFQLVTQLESPEPGAGLLRDQPELVKIAKLQTHAGRGSIRLYVVDETTGGLKYEIQKADEPKQASKKGRGGAAAGMAGMGMAGGMGRMMGNQGGTAKDDAAAKKKREEEERRLGRGIAGDANVAQAETKQEAADPNLPPGADYVTERKGFRWAVITGVVDNKHLRDSYARALKLDPSGAFAHFLRVELQRRERRDDGTWTDYQLVDRDYSVDNVLSLLSDIEAETNADNLPIVQDSAKLKELCDELPFLEAGYWAGVYHGDVINPEVLKKKDDKPAARPGAGGMMSGGMMSGGMGAAGGMADMMPGRGGSGGRGPAGGMMSGGMGTGGAGMSGMMPGGAGMAGGSGGMMGGIGRMMGMGEAGGGSFGSYFGSGASGDNDPNFTKSEADKLMVRVLDFTVLPDKTYQYRARLVVRNPNYGVDNVLPGVDKVSKELRGPWSDDAPIVSVPPDIQTYVRGLSTPEIRARQPGALTFGVVRWNQADGLTVVSRFEEGMGELIGEAQGAYIPVEERDATRLRSRTIDFASNRLLLDSGGESVDTNRLKVGVPGFNLPAVAVLLRGDGRIEVRDEASEEVIGELAEMESIYNQTKKDAETGDKKTSNPFGGMMGGMMGMMGAG